MSASIPILFLSVSIPLSLSQAFPFLQSELWEGLGLDADRSKSCVTFIGAPISHSVQASGRSKKAI